MVKLPLDRKTLILLALGLVAVVLLVFLAGYLVGLNSNLAEAAAPDRPSRRAEPSARQTPPPVQEAEPEPVEPVPYSDEPVPLDEPEPLVDAEMLAEEEMAAEPTVPLGDEPEPAGDYSVQLGAFRTEEHAESLAGELRDQGLQPDVVVAEDANLGTLYKVRVGRYATLEAAERVAARVRADFGRDAWPVTIR